MAKLCLCLTGKTIQDNLATLEAYRGTVDMAELRADFLSRDEQYYIRSFPERAGLPVILTVRRPADGGAWRDGEGARLVLMAKGLAFAEADAKKNFAYVDLEGDLRVPAVEEAARAFGTRIIRSHHDMEGTPADCDAILRGLPHHPDEIPKLAVRPRCVADSARLFRAAAGCGHAQRIVVGMGEEGFWTRALPSRLGSLLTYASALDAGKASAARGQVDPRTLCGPFRFRSVGEGTGVFAVAGTMVFSSGLAQALNEALAEAGIDAVFVPFAVDSLPEFMSFADDLRIRGAAICSPYRFDASAYCSWIDRAARSSGAVTFIRKYSGGWKGFDLDSLCIDQAIKLVLGRRWRPLLRGVVAGSGALAQAAVDALRARRVRVLVTDRSLTASASGRRRPGVRWTGPDSQGLSPKSIGHTLFVKASLASEEAQEDDPVPGYFFSGRETALDLAREGPRSRFAQRAAEASCRVEDATEFVGFQSARILRLVAGEEGA